MRTSVKMAFTATADRRRVPSRPVRLERAGSARAASRRGRDAVVGLAILALFVAATFSVCKGVYFAMEYSQDFQWSPTVLLSEGHDPYAWYLNGNAGERIILSQEPNYLQLLYVLLLPFAYLTWPAAKLTWALCNVAAGALSAHLIARDCGLRGVKYLAALGAFLAAAPFAHGLGNGQQSLFVLLALTVAWRWRRSAGGGPFLAVAAVKYSFLPTVGLWLLCERRLPALAAAGLVTAASLGAFAYLSGAGLLSAVLEPLRVSAIATHVGLGDAMSLARGLGLDAQFGTAAPYLVGLACVGASVAAIWRFRDRLDEITIFALLNLASLFSLFHNLYDYVALLPLFVRGLNFSGALRAATLAYVGYFWFVLNHFDSFPAMKTPAAIAVTALASAAMLTFVLLRGSRAGGREAEPAPLPAPYLLQARNRMEDRIPCPSPNVSPPWASLCRNPPRPSPTTSAR